MGGPNTTAILASKKGPFFGPKLALFLTPFSAQKGVKKWANFGAKNGRFFEQKMAKKVKNAGWPRVFLYHTGPGFRTPAGPPREGPRRVQNGRFPASAGKRRGL